MQSLRSNFGQILPPIWSTRSLRPHFGLFNPASMTTGFPQSRSQDTSILIQECVDLGRFFNTYWRGSSIDSDGIRSPCTWLYNTDWDRQGNLVEHRRVICSMLEIFEFDRADHIVRLELENFERARIGIGLDSIRTRSSRGFSSTRSNSANIVIAFMS